MDILELVISADAHWNPITASEMIRAAARSQPDSSLAGKRTFFMHFSFRMREKGDDCEPNINISHQSVKEEIDPSVEIIHRFRYYTKAKNALWFGPEYDGNNFSN